MSNPAFSFLIVVESDTNFSLVLLESLFEVHELITKLIIMTIKIEFLMSLFFFALAHNDRGYGLGRSAGGFPVAMATKEMRAQRLPEAH